MAAPKGSAGGRRKGRAPAKKTAPRNRPEGPSKSEQKAAELQELMAEKSQLLAGSEGYKHYRSVLTLAQNRHPYSFGNLALIGWQLPTASIVLPHSGWKAVGRQVLPQDKGGQPLYILRPNTRIITERDEKTGEEQKRSVLRGEAPFSSTHTYDISSTVGPEMPAPKKLVGEAPDQVWLGVTQLLERAGYRVEFHALKSGLDGFTDAERKRVVINNQHDPLHQLSTVIHEFHHIAMGHVSEGFDYRQHRGRAEVEAEGATFVAMGLLGVDTSSDSIFYVTDWAKGEIAPILEAGDRVVKFGRATGEALDPSLRREAGTAREQVGEEIGADLPGLVLPTPEI